MHDAETKKAAAALAVGTGAGSDPAHLPGLAHFTEHMSMQGSDLFPGDNTYKVLSTREKERLPSVTYSTSDPNRLY